MRYFKYKYDGRITELFRVYENDTWEFIKLDEDRRKNGWCRQVDPNKKHFSIDVLPLSWGGKIIECTKAELFAELL